MEINNKDTLQKGIRPLTLEEMEAVSGGFWNIIGAAALILIGCVVEIFKHNSDPDPLKGFGKDDD